MKNYRIINTESGEAYTDSIFSTREEAEAKMDFYSEPYLAIQEIETNERFLTVAEVENVMAEVSSTFGKYLSVEHRSAGTWRIYWKGGVNVPVEGAKYIELYTETHEENLAENLDHWEKYFIDRLEEYLMNYRIIEIVK